jgi:hypothetical protein
MAVQRLDGSSHPGELSVPTRCTLLALVQTLSNTCQLNEDEVVRQARSLVTSGRVVLTGNFAGTKLRPC